LDRATVAACSIHTADLPLEHRAGEKPTVRKTLTVARSRAGATREFDISQGLALGFMYLTLLQLC